MKIFLTLLTALCFQNTFAQTVSGTATLEKSPVSAWATFQVHGATAEELYKMLNVNVQLGGIKRGPSITCVKTIYNSYYCSMSVNTKGELEGDGISSINPGF